MATMDNQLDHGTSMMSPGAKVTIQDFSEYTASQSTSVIGILGPARKGPLKPTLVTSANQFIKTFGAPDGKSYGAYSAIYFLTQGNKVYYQRIIHGGAVATAGESGTDKFTVSATQAGESFNGITVDFDPNNTDNTVTVTLKNKDGNQLEQYTSKSLDSNSVDYISKVINGSSAYITLSQHSTGGVTKKTLVLAGGEDGGSDAVGGSDSVVFTSLTFDSTLNGSKVRLSKKDFTGYFDYTLLDQNNQVLESFATVSDDPNDDRYLPLVLEHYSDYLSATVSTTGELIKPALDTSKYTEVSYSDLKKAVPAVTSTTPVLKVYSSESGLNMHSYWVYPNGESALDSEGDVLPGTDKYYQVLNSAGFTWADKDELPYDKDDSTKKAYQLAGIAYMMSTSVMQVGSSSVKSDGIALNYNNDQLINWMSSNNVRSIDATPKSKVVNIDDQTYELSGGRDGVDGITNSDYIGDSSAGTGIYSMSNPDTFIIDLFAIPGMTDPSVLSQAAKMVSDRGDSFMITDVPFGLRPQDAVDWTNGQGTWSGKHSAFDTSFMGFYAPWAQVRDTYTNKLIWLPPTVVVPARYAYTDNVGGPWLAPAGADRGKIDGIVQLEYSPTMGERDLMYGNRNVINPIVSMGVTGTIINGQKTAQRKPTALDRINVRRLVNYVERMLQETAQYFVFEPNDSSTWQRWITVVEPKLEALQNSQAISAYKLQMDEGTVSADDLENGRMPGLVAIKPVKSAEFIPITLRIDSQSTVYNDTTGSSLIGD